MRSITAIGIVAALICPMAATAQSPTAAPPVTGPGTSIPALPPASSGQSTAQQPAIVTPIDVYPDERTMFELGDFLGRAAFINGAIVRQINLATATDDRDAELTLLEKLAPDALRNRSDQLEYFTAARQLMWNMRAPGESIVPVTKAIIHLRKPPQYTGQTQLLAQTNPSAALTLCVLEDNPNLSSVPESPALRAWVDVAAREHNGHVWYAEGLIAGIGDIAAQNKMPGLLPNAADIATDLAGLRDWITLRLPDTPSPDQLALRADVASLLDSVTKYDHAGAPITQYQLMLLGQVNTTIEAEVIGMPQQNLQTVQKLSP